MVGAVFLGFGDVGSGRRNPGRDGDFVGLVGIHIGPEVSKTTKQLPSNGLDLAVNCRRMGVKDSTLSEY